MYRDMRYVVDLRHPLQALAEAVVRLEGHEKTYIQSSRPWECGNPEGISKECGKGGKPASWVSMLSTLCHFHGLLFARQCWINRYAATQRNAPHPARDAYRTHRVVNECIGDKSLVGRCQSSATEPSHNTFEFRIVRLSTVRPDAISSEDPL